MLLRKSLTIKARGDITGFGSIIDTSIQVCNSYLTNFHVEFMNYGCQWIKAATSSTTFSIFDEIPICITDLIFNEVI